jgi:hypothetical protein
MAAKIRGYRWNMNYRGLNIYSHVSKGDSIAVDANGVHVASTDTSTGEIFALVDDYLTARGF